VDLRASIRRKFVYCWDGQLLARPGSASRTLLHQGQHNPELSDAGVEQVTITAPHHPLVGQSFRSCSTTLLVGADTANRTSSSGVPMGHRSWYPAGGRRSVLARRNPRWPWLGRPAACAPLLSMVAALRCNAEVADGPAAPGGSLEHVQSPNPAPPGLRLDRAAWPIAPGAARAFERRER